MSAETVIFSTLTGNAPLTAVVSDRVYPDFLTQLIALPAIVTERDDTEYVTTIHSGVVLGSQVFMNVWCMADTRIDSNALADLVEAALPAGGFLLVGRFNQFDEETRTYSTIIRCSIWP